MIKLCSEMRKAFQAELEVLLTQVAEEFKLDVEAVMAFAEEKRREASEEVSEAVDKSRKQKKKRATKKKEEEVESEGEVQQEERGKCQGKTAKGCACKNNALAGLQFCHVHNKKNAEEEATPVKKEAKAKKAPKAPKKAKKAEHNHGIEQEGEECERCAEQGDPRKELQFEVEDDVDKQLQEFIAEMEEEEEEEQ